MGARLIQYNARKMKRLQALMDDIRVNGFDDAKALERDTLVRYFYAFREKHQADRELSVFAERWVQAIESHQTPGIGAIAAQKRGQAIFDPKTGRQTVPLKPGDICVVQAARTGRWDKQHEIQWLVNGVSFRTAKGDDPRAAELRFDSTGMEPGDCAVAVRIIDVSGRTRKILAHRSVYLTLGEDLPVMAPFRVRSALKDYDGPPLPPSVQNGDILAFQADLKHPDGEAQPAQLVWQVYDQAGKPIQELGKQEQILAAGETRNHRFKIRLDDLGEGGYAVRLTHFFTARPDGKTQAEARFRVSQPVRIERVLVTDDPGDQTHKPVLSPDQAPLLYAHYRLSPGVKKANIMLTAKDADGRVIETVAVERPRPGETPPYRVGLAVPNAKVPIGAEIIFEAEITAGGGKRHAARTAFRKEAYRLVLNVPETLRSGESKPFSITVPKSFRGPFTVDVRATGRGLSAGHAPGNLSGTVGGIAAGTAEIGNLTVSVTDADGKKASAQARVEIQPAGKVFSIPTPPAQKFSPPPVAPQLPPSTPGPISPSHSGIESASSSQQKPMPEPQVKAHQKKSEPQTVYWVVNTSTWSRHSQATTMRAQVTTGNQPPVTGFSQPVSGAAGHYHVVVKAYGTLDPREAQQIANGINQGKYRDVFPRTRHDVSGHIGKGLEGSPLVNYGPGVKALAGPAQAARATAESAGKKSSAFRNEAARRLNALAAGLEAGVRKMAGDISVLQYSIDNSKKALAQDLAELKRIAAPLGAKARTMTKEQFMARHGAEFRQAAQMESRYNEKTKAHNRLVEKRNGLIKRQKEIAALYDAVSAAWRKGDVERCIEIANGSPLAKEFGYKPLSK
ncbi:MAG: Ig domain-containing protein [Syntrophales bacterium]|nr:Ig domain-containing protein [Syntrophales bacterium]